MKQRKRAQLGTLSLETILPLIGQANPDGKYRHQVTIDGKTYSIKTGSHRLHLFLKSRKCITCGRVGTHFVLEQDPGHANPHVNLYSSDGVLMTKDHIQPRSKGGKDVMSNYQTMCVKCNVLKGATYEPESATC